MPEPVPATGYGPAAWEDFTNNWRKADGDFLQARSVLRYETTASRNAITPTPPAGTTIYNFETDRIEYRTKTSTWNALYHLNGLVIEPVAADHRLRHPSNATSGLVFTPTQIIAQVPITTPGGELRFEAGGLTISTDRDARLTTDANYLLSDTHFSAPGLTSTTTLGVTGAATLGSLSVTGTATVTGLLTANGQIALAATTAANHAARKDYVDAQRDTRVAKVGDSMSGLLNINPGIDTCLRLCGNGDPLLEWRNASLSVRYAYINARGTGMNIVSDAGDIVLNSGGGQVRTSDAVYASGGLRGFLNGPCLRLIGTGANVYQEFYGAGSSVDSAGSRYGYFGFNGNGHMQIRNECGGGYIYLSSYGGGLIFVANNAERARFDTSGHFLIGMVSSNPYSDVGLDIATDGEIYSTTSTTTGRNLNCHHVSSSDANTRHFIRFSRATTGTGIGSISQNGTSGVVYNTTSDYRRKRIVGPITDALARVMALRPLRAVFIDDDERGEVDVFVAHEAQEVIPDAVSGEKDAVDDEGNPVYQEMDYSRPTPLLAAAIQELAERVTALESAA